MSREIKFRAWDKRYGLVKIHHLDFSEKSGNIHTIHGSFDNGQSSLSTDDKKETILMQYTGLKDCKGREIYEGDIIKAKIGAMDFILEIKFEYGKFMAIYDDDELTAFDLFTITDKCEVIGNIYKNRDLLQ